MSGSCGHLPALGMQGSCNEPTGTAAASTAHAASSGMVPSSASVASSATLEQQAAQSRAALSAAAAAATGSGTDILDPPLLRADGALFILELLQLLKSGAAAGNLFLSNLRDLLECALDAHAAEDAAALLSAGSGGNLAGSDVSGSQLKVDGDSQAREAGSMQVIGSAPAAASKHTAIDAAAFVGILQEAAAPLLFGRARAPQGHESSTTGSLALEQKLLPARGSEAAEAFSSSTGSLVNKSADAAKGLRALRTDRSSTTSGSSSADGGSNAGLEAAAGVAAAPGDGGSFSSGTLQPHLLRQQLSKGSINSSNSSSNGSNSPMLCPVHARAAAQGCKDSGSVSSCGGSGPGTPRGAVPQLLGPQTVPELLYTRAALITLMISAHTFVQGPAYSHMANKLEGIAELYDSMHDDPVVTKRRKCREMELMRDEISKGAQFSQARTLYCVWPYVGEDCLLLGSMSSHTAMV